MSLKRAGETLRLPDPDAAHRPGAYMQKNIWFENCGDGGVWILGVEGMVYLMYVDSPGDMIYSQWSCSRERWESLWTKAFGARQVTLQAPTRTQKP